MFRVLLAACFIAQVLSASVQQGNSQPIIGVLALQDDLHRLDSETSIIGGSYVKFLEQGGARVVPIFVKQNESYYEDLLKKINGVLLPGGTAKLDANVNGYGKAVDYIYELAKKFNDNGDYFPVWGTCLGFEVLAYQEAGNTRDVLSTCVAFNVAYPLKFELENGRMHRDLPILLRNAAETEKLTFNIHFQCVTRPTLKRTGTLNNWRILTTNRDMFGIEFISSFEHVKYPFYGTQFHPEKNPFEWNNLWNIPHSENAVALSHYYARFFVNEARKSKHRFSSKIEELSHLIYNFQPTYTAGQSSVPFFKRLQFDQTYFFNLKTDYPKLV